jgi:predicted DNA-binding transcriptional regulator AlpA
MRCSATSKTNSDALAVALAFTVPQFCSTHGISRALFYILQREGNGPRVMKAGRRTLVSREAAADWRSRMETRVAA